MAMITHCAVPIRKSGHLILLFCIMITAGCRSTPKQEMEERLDTIVIEEIDFRQAPVGEVIESLVDLSMLMTGKSVLEQKAIHPNLPFWAEASEPTFPKIVWIRIREEEQIQPVTLHLKQVSLREVLDAVCRMAGFRYEISRYGEMVVYDPVKKDAANAILDETVIENFLVEKAELSVVISQLLDSVSASDAPYGLSVIYNDKDSGRVNAEEGELGGADPFGFERPASRVLEKPRIEEKIEISMHLKNATVREIFEEICKQAGMNFEVHPRGFILLTDK